VYSVGGSARRPVFVLGTFPLQIRQPVLFRPGKRRGVATMREPALLQCRPMTTAPVVIKSSVTAGGSGEA
jgi:hypothetical protein